jgi:hypothetical protein
MRVIAKQFIILTILFLFTASIAIAVELDYWRKNPSLTELTSNEQDLDAVYIQDVRTVKYVDGSTRLESYITVHKIIRVNKVEALDKVNKIYISIRSSDKIIKINARSISPSGNIVELDENSIKDITDVNDHYSLKVFAIEGAQTGGEIEYIYKIRTGAYSSNRETYKMDYQVREGLFSLTYPENYVFLLKTYNNQDKIEVTPKGYRIEFKDLKPQLEERYVTKKANRFYIDYVVKSAEITDEYGFKKIKKYVTWQKIVKPIKDQLNDYSKKSNSLAKKVITTNLLGVEPASEEAILGVENYIKNNFIFVHKNNEEYRDDVKMLKSKLGNEIALIKLYNAFFTRLGIDFRVVVTSNRYVSKFDVNFPTRMNMREFVLYFPKYKQFLYPASVNYRYGKAPTRVLGNEGLEINLKNGEVFFVKIAPPKLENLRTEKEYLIDIDVVNSITDINIDMRWNGYKSVHMNSDYESAESEEEKQKQIEGHISCLVDDAVVSNVESTGWGDNDKSCLGCYRSISGSLRSSILLESVGEKVFFSVGKIIGPQWELYQENDRIQNISISHPHEHHHRIKVNIPKGYSLKGLDEIKVDNKALRNDKTILMFLSDYTLEEDVLEITIIEKYFVVDLDTSEYDGFRKVVNSAADFNNIVLVLEKK